MSYERKKNDKGFIMSNTNTNINITKNSQSLVIININNVDFESRMFSSNMSTYIRNMFCSKNTIWAIKTG